MLSDRFSLGRRVRIVASPGAPVRYDEALTSLRDLATVVEVRRECSAVNVERLDSDASEWVFWDMVAPATAEKAAPVLASLDSLRSFGAWDESARQWTRQWPLAAMPGKHLTLHEDATNADIDGECCLWSGALVLAKALELPGLSKEMRGATVLELGAGTGLVSLVAASLGATVVSTEQSKCLPFLERNVKRNAWAGKVSAQALDWGEGAEPIAGVTHILGSDITYHERLFEILKATLLTMATPETRILLAQDANCLPRGDLKRAAFVAFCADKFDVSDLEVTLPAAFRDDDIRLLELRRKA